MPTAILYLRSRRAERMKRVQVVQHLFAAVVLIVTGWDHLGHGRVLPYFEVAAGAILIGAAIRERVRHTHSRVGWLEIAGAAMLTVEGLAKLQERHHLPIYILAFLQPLLLLAFGVFDVQIAQRRYLKADDHGLELRTRLFWWKRVPWEGLRTYRIAEKALFLDERKISLRDIINRQEADGWLRAELARRGLSES
ncbi:MAG TPA: hypothetical protein VGR02_21985 [Thermoanaerobaculia bacterium]|jgi:hypothetical protein|nr:hypothetical protein [Thermoanaerobaculia bacterium]